MQTIQKKGLTVKDLVTIGIFSALFLVFALVGGIFFIHPIPHKLYFYDLCIFIIKTNEKGR